MKLSARLSLTVMAVALLSGCTSTPPGAAAVPAAEIRGLIAGNTWMWASEGPGAGLYFAPDQKAFLHWRGTTYETTWSVRDGAFCYQHTSGDRCWGVYRRDGQLVSRSLWQPEFANPYDWNYQDEVRRGRHVPA